MNILNSREVLKLNRDGRPVGFFTPQQVFVDFASYMVDRRQDYLIDRGGGKKRKMLGYDIDFHQREDGSYDFDTMTVLRAVDWDEWITLPIRSFDLFVNTPKMKIRIPRIVRCLTSQVMPETRHNKSLDSVYNLYGKRCVYTNRLLSKNEASRDHVIPLDRGGTDTIDNIVLACREINSRKGNRYNHEVGLPEVIPIVPKRLPMDRALRNHKDVPEWRWILNK